MTETTYRVTINGRELALFDAEDAGVLSRRGFRVTAVTESAGGSV